MGNDRVDRQQRGGAVIARRDFLKLGGAGLAALATAGCSDLASGFVATSTAGPNTLILSKGPDTSGTLPKLLDKFNQEQHGFSVQLEVMPADTGQYFDKMRTQFQIGGGDIDVIGGDVIWPSQLAAHGWIEDLSDLFTQQMQSDYLDATIRTSMYKGRIYGVPWYSDAGLLYYRKDLLAKAGFKPPRTWDELVHQAQKIRTQGDVKSGFTFQGADYEGGVCNQCEYIWNGGGDILDPQDATKVVIGRQGSVRGLQSVQKNVVSGAAPLAVATYKELESLTPFIQGDALFNRNWPYAYAVATGGAATGSSLKPDQVGVAHVPGSEPGAPRFATLGGWNFYINSASKKKEQAWHFIQWMSKPSTMKVFAIQAGYLPPRKSLFEDKALLKKQPVMALAKDSYKTTKPRPSTDPFYSDMSLYMSQEFNNVVVQAESAEASAARLQQRLQRIVTTAKNIFNLS